MGCIWGRSHVFNMCCITQNFKSTFEFSPIVSSDTNGVPKHLKHFLLDCSGNCVTALILNDCKDNKFAETTNCCQKVYLAVSCPQVYYEVQGPLTPWSRWKWE